MVDRLILAVPYGSTFRWDGNEGLSEVLHDLGRDIIRAHRVCLNLLSSSAGAAELLRLKSVSVISATILGVAIIVGGASITIHVSKLGIALAGCHC